MYQKNRLFTIFKRHYFLVLIIVFLIYSAIAIYRSSFVVHDVRYFSLFDDMMISMRYAYNLAHGHGLVWNAGGERVEGFTNLLWVLFMSLIHLSPIPLAKMSLVIQVASATIMVGVLYYVKKITSFVTKGSAFAIFLSLIFTAFYFPLISWTVILGTEVSILTLLLTISVFLALMALKTKKFPLLLFIVLGIGTLVRMDFVIPAIAITGFLFFFDKKNRKKYLLIGLPLIVIFVMGQTIYRLWYYNEILPNTYYLKMTGYPIFNRITRGVYVSLHFMNLFLLLIPFVYYYFTKNKNILLLLIVFSTQILYNMYVGGDAQEWYGGANRFIAIAMPLFFIALVTTIYSVDKFVKKHFINLYKNYKIFEIVTVCFFFLVINTAANNMIFQLFFISKPFLANENKNQVEEAYFLKEITLPGAKIGVTHAGGAPYFLPDRYFVDLLGKNDKVIAREVSKPPLASENRFEQYINYQPGHNKWDYPYILKTYKPDIFIEFWQRSDGHDADYLARDYIKLIDPVPYGPYILKNSRYINFKALNDNY